MGTGTITHSTKSVQVHVNGLPGLYQQRQSGPHPCKGIVMVFVAHKFFLIIYPGIQYHGYTSHDHKNYPRTCCRGSLPQAKTTFTTAPILWHPDPAKPFVVQMDTSEFGVRAVLFRCFGENINYILWLFFSRKLSLAEQNCDVGNQELFNETGTRKVPHIHLLHSQTNTWNIPC